MLVVASSSLPVGSHRRNGAGVLRRLHRRKRQAVDPAHRLQARQSRDRRGRSQTVRQPQARAADRTCPPLVSSVCWSLYFSGIFRGNKSDNICVP